jgi:rhodanese-related sulfurtransferase
MKISRTYLILAILLAGLAFVLVLLPKTTRNKEIQPELLIKKINDPARFLSPDFIAERLINEDPSIMLIDVRSPEQFVEFTMPGAMNIPLSEVIKPDWEEYLNQDDKDLIFFSNDDLYADQAWILCTRLNYKNLYVMKGGLNQWFKDIINPVLPVETAPKEEFDLYSFRKAASLYFSGAGNDIQVENKNEKNILIKREKKTTTAGGC